MTIPRRLKAVIKRNNGRYHPIANELGINVFWVYNYIAKGREHATRTFANSYSCLRFASHAPLMDRNRNCLITSNGGDHWTRKPDLIS